jgi:hypothetical protein
VESGTPNDLVMVGLITVQTDFDLSAGRAEDGNQSVRKQNAIRCQFGFPTLNPHVRDQFGQAVMNRWLSAAEVDRLHGMRQKPVNPPPQRLD